MKNLFLGIEFNILKRPRSKRDLRNRGLLLGAIIVAFLLPVLVIQNEGSESAFLDTPFFADLMELRKAREEIKALKSTGSSDPLTMDVLKNRIDDLEKATFLGYIKKEEDSFSLGGLAPDFRLLNLSGEAFRLHSFDKPVVINFWTSWCASCIEEMVSLQLLNEHFNGEIIIAGINRGESQTDAISFADRIGATYTLLLDTDDTLSSSQGPYHSAPLPTTVYIRADGVIDAIKTGFHEFNEMLKMANDLLSFKFTTQANYKSPLFEAQVRNTIASQVANNSIARELFSQLVLDSMVLEDKDWLRNISIQSRIWESNLELIRTLDTPPSLSEEISELIDSFELLKSVGALFQESAEINSASTSDFQVERVTKLFIDAASEFEQAADRLIQILQIQNGTPSD